MNSIQLHFIGVYRCVSVADLASLPPCLGVSVAQRWDRGPAEGRIGPATPSPGR